MQTYSFWLPISLRWYLPHWRNRIQYKLHYNTPTIIIQPIGIFILNLFIILVHTPQFKFFCIRKHGVFWAFSFSRYIFSGLFFSHFFFFQTCNRCARVPCILQSSHCTWVQAISPFNIFRVNDDFASFQACHCLEESFAQLHICLTLSRLNITYKTLTIMLLKVS